MFRTEWRSTATLHLTAVTLLLLAGFGLQYRSSQSQAADPKPNIGAHGSAVFVETAELNMRDAKRAITGRNLRVRGIPGDVDPNNGTLVLKAKDGTVTVSGIHYPEEIGRLKQDGLQVTVEIEGAIRRKKTNNELTFYTSEIRRMSWQARDDSGTVVEKGERRGIQ
jgi:hypothetical protein